MPARLDAFRPGDLTAEQRRLYDRLLGSPRATAPRPFPLADEEGRLRGPFNAMLLNPDLGHALQELGGAVRYRTGLTPRQREIAILAVAGHERSDYEWKVHSHAALLEGLTEAQLAGLRGGADRPFDDPAERAVLEAARELLRTGDLTDDTFAASIDVLGQTRLYEVVTLVGYYRLLAAQLRVLRVDG
ncbi:carboxymuconolactone decarboxylase family protein [Nonomuraea sp. NEAU-A123]|uniref:carboxymuconolactone decarboxylase family protein n=1 Tax=Nonomuraea sp. NEAU-A123 TaxID=2839649 RepID=UPI001BE3DFF0|nr:carboxymuconolactone decarboxylase family protein [Nonomuraea sp. NEAU-A123]MBT2229231.1 carboxymuconolactone decarboxylase family protein [Nonomuraea sp. NEAU-A123]